jgi:hypothetical protein
LQKIPRFTEAPRLLSIIRLLPRYFAGLLVFGPINLAPARRRTEQNGCPAGADLQGSSKEMPLKHDSRPPDCLVPIGLQTKFPYRS